MDKVVCFFIVAMTLIGCSGPKLSEYGISEPYRVFFVNPVKGDDSNDGLTTEKPFRSIQQAQYAVRSINKAMTGDIYIVLCGGRYKLNSPIIFSSEDSGYNGHYVIYKGADEERAVLDGGEEITGWECIDKTKRIYRAKIEAGERFRQLYIDDKQAIRARTPNANENWSSKGYYKDVITFNGGKRLFPTQNIPFSKGMEMVFIDHWKQKRVTPIGIKKSAAGNEWVFSAHTLQNYIFSVFPQEKASCYYENAFEFLDSENEWFLDPENGLVYFIPPQGCNPNRMKIIRPVADGLINFIGSSTSTPVENIVLYGMNITNVNYVNPDELGNLSVFARTSIVDEKLKNYIVPGSIMLKNASGVIMRDLQFTHSGSHAVVAEADIVKNCTVENCEISNTAGGGIYFNLDSPESTGNMVKNCYISNIGLDYTDSVAISFASTPDVKILNNTIENCPYSGICFGGVNNDDTTAARNVIVKNNKISNIMKVHDDGAGIYTRGKIPGVIIENNYVSGIKASAIQGGYNIAAIYLDDGSNGKDVINNVVDNCPIAFSAKNKLISNNTFIGNWYNCNFGEIKQENTVRNNKRVSFNNWPSKAVKIMEQAGSSIESPTIGKK